MGKVKRSATIALGMLVILIMMLGGCTARNTSEKAGYSESTQSNSYENTADKVTEKGYAPAYQRQEIGKYWWGYSVQLNETVVTLPCEVKDIEAAGLAMDTSLIPADMNIARGANQMVYFKDKSGDEIMVTVTNGRSVFCKITECLVTGIAVTNYDLKKGSLTVTFPGGIQIGSPQSLVLESYGTFYDGYESDDAEMFTWHSSSNYNRSCEIDFDTKTNKVTCMFLTYQFRN